MSTYGEEEKKKKVIVTSFSGGRTSAFGTQAVEKHFPDEEVYHIFMDTGAEHPATYDFVNGVDEIFNLDLIRLRVSINPELGKGNAFDVVNGTVTQFDLKPYTDTISKYGVPYVGGMFCTDRMKTTPFKKYCEKRWGKGNYEVWLGIRGDEPKRLVGFNKTKPDLSCYTQLRLCDLQDEDITDLFVQARKEGVYQAIIDCGFPLSNKAIELFSKRIVALDADNMHYLAEIEPHFYKQDTYIYWNKQDQLYGVDLRIPDYLGNCEFCPKKSNLKIAAAAKAEPEHFKLWVSMLTSDRVRTGEKTGCFAQMYRGKRSVLEIVEEYKDFTLEELESRIRGGHMEDAGSCSESCEVFPTY